MKGIKYLSLNPDTIDRYKECFDSNGSPKILENLQWQFFNNTTSKFVVVIAFDELKNKVAGIYAVSLVKIKIGDNVYFGSQSLDTITDKDYRGRGLFTLLANSVYAQAINEGVDLVYGFPNGKSIHGFQKKLEWEVMDPLPMLIKPLRTKYFTDKLKFLRYLPNVNIAFNKLKQSKRYSISEEGYFPSDVDKVWAQFSRHFQIAVVRDRDYLTWRYIQKPNEIYRIVHCRDNNSNYKGFIVFTIKTKHNGKIGYIMELIFDPAHLKAGQLLLNYAICEMRKEDADCVLAWCFDHSPNHMVFRNELFLKMPERLRPIELHFGARCTKPELFEKVINRRNWYISYSDSDTV